MTISTDHGAAVTTERRDNVLILSLNQPRRRNALSVEMLAALGRELHGLDPAETAGVVITGTGDSFSAGADFRDITGTPADEAYDDRVADVANLIITAPVPVIGVVRGACMGAACDLLMSCDVVVAEPTAFLQVPAVKLGLLYNPSAVARMYARLPDATVRRMLVLGERFDAAAAHAAGLVSEILPEDTALSWAVGVLTGSWVADGHQARSATKALLNDLSDRHADMDRWQRTRRVLMASKYRLRRVAQAKTRHRA